MVQSWNHELPSIKIFVKVSKSIDFPRASFNVDLYRSSVDEMVKYNTVVPIRPPEILPCVVLVRKKGYSPSLGSRVRVSLEIY